VCIRLGKVQYDLCPSVIFDLRHKRSDLLRDRLPSPRSYPRCLCLRVRTSCHRHEHPWHDPTPEAPRGPVRRASTLFVIRRLQSAGVEGPEKAGRQNAEKSRSVSLTHPSISSHDFGLGWASSSRSWVASDIGGATPRCFAPAPNGATCRPLRRHGLG